MIQAQIYREWGVAKGPRLLALLECTVPGVARSKRAGAGQ